MRRVSDSREALANNKIWDSQLRILHLYELVLSIGDFTKVGCAGATHWKREIVATYFTKCQGHEADRMCVTRKRRITFRYNGSVECEFNGKATKPLLSSVAAVVNASSLSLLS